ncbi:hypothetical protein G6F31_020341 [Rhizopus arrhizus]|nr:hypothetical protein G6F31_020341 [Rhizopus arrhizus]
MLISEAVNSSTSPPSSHLPPLALPSMASSPAAFKCTSRRRGAGRHRRSARRRAGRRSVDAASGWSGRGPAVPVLRRPACRWPAAGGHAPAARCGWPRRMRAAAAAVPGGRWPAGSR